MDTGISIDASVEHEIISGHYTYANVSTISSGHNNDKLRFIDLFAGLGGFHAGMVKNGFECVFACEIDSELRQLYEVNHGIKPHDDIRTIDEREIPEHDLICAGFPCQPFSLAGSKKGAECPKSGRLIDEVVRIARYHKPKFVLLENVPKILTIAEGTFWDYLNNSFSNIGYDIQYKVISPVDIGIPQNRKRVFVLATRRDLKFGQFEWPTDIVPLDCNLLNLLDKRKPHKKLQIEKVALLSHWQNLLDNLGSKSVSHHSLVAPEFGANYPFDFSQLSLQEIKVYKGAYGVSLEGCESWEDVLDLMPSYTRKNRFIPEWMLHSIRFSRHLYSENEDFLDRWSQGLCKRNNSWQILEWRGLRNPPNIYANLVQFRASGIRVIRPDVAPSLISMTSTQIPVIPSESRYISSFEAAKLQHLHNLKSLPLSTTSAFKALGNAVNAKVVELIACNLKSIFLA